MNVKSIATAVATIAMGFTLSACSTAAPTVQVAPPVTVTKTVETPAPVIETTPVPEYTSPIEDAPSGSSSPPESIQRSVLAETWETSMNDVDHGTICQAWGNPNKALREDFLDKMLNVTGENISRGVLRDFIGEQCANF